MLLSSLKVPPSPVGDGTGIRTQIPECWNQASVSVVSVDWVEVMVILMHNDHNFFFLQMVQAFTHSPAFLEADKGGKFQLLDGSVTGEFTELVSTVDNTFSVAQ